MALLWDDDFCRIVHEPGDNGMAVISFAGVGYALGGMQIEEFRRSLDGSHFDIYFVIDKKRHWYNGIYERVLAVINASLEARGIARCFTLGNSMGGFGAVLFAGALSRCMRAIAFCPQSSVSPVHAPFENRWREWTASITAWRAPDAIAAMTEEVQSIVFFGAIEARDQLHAQRFAAAEGNAIVCVIENCSHNIATYLKQRGVLIPLLNSLLTIDPIDRWRLTSLLGRIPHRMLSSGP